MNFIDLGNEIRKEREKLGHTQEELAELSHISTSYIGQIERAERNVTIPVLVDIADALDVSIDYLLSRPESIVDKSLENKVYDAIEKIDKEDKLMVIDIIKVISSHKD